MTEPTDGAQPPQGVQVAARHVLAEDVEAIVERRGQLRDHVHRAG